MTDLDSTFDSAPQALALTLAPVLTLPVTFARHVRDDVTPCDACDACDASGIL